MFLFRLFTNESLEKTLLIIGALVIAALSCTAFVLLLIQAAFDIAEGKNYTLYLFLLPLTAILFVVSKRLAQKNGIAVTEAALEKLQTGIVNDARHAELPDIEKLNPSDIYIQLGDAQMLSKAALTFIEVSQSILIALFIWFYISWMSFLTGQIMLFLAVFVIGCHKVLQHLIKEKLLSDSEKESDLIEFCNDMLFGFKELKTDEKKNDDLFDNYIRPSVSLLKNSRVEIRFYMSEIIPLIHMVCFISMGFIVFILPLHDSPETIFRLLTLSFYTLTHAMVIGVGTPEIIHGEDILKKLDQMLIQKDRGQSEYIYSPYQEFITDFQEIALRDIVYQYYRPDGEADFSIGPLSLTVRNGSLLFIVGGNGTGKTTLLRILTGLYAPSAGAVQIDGQDVRISEYRHLFSSVFSDFHLFDRLYGADPFDENKLSELLERLELAHKTRYENGRFTTIDLSAGQKRRLALAVALTENKPIYVFDEWAADQDPHFRRYFYETLLPSLKSQGKTVIAVTHDDRFFHVADRVIRMEDGQFRETK